MIREKVILNTNVGLIALFVKIPKDPQFFR